MIRIFGKWLGFDMELNGHSVTIDIGLWRLFYITYYWDQSSKFKIEKSMYSRCLYWKHVEIGMMR